APGALRRAEPIAVVAKDHERPAPEVAGMFEIARDQHKGRQSDGRCLARKRWKERRSELIGPCRGGDGAIDQPPIDPPLSDGEEGGLDRPTAGDERLAPLNERDERSLRRRPAPRRGAVNSNRRKDESCVAGDRDDEGTDRDDQAGGRRERRTGKRRDDLRAHQVALTPAQSALRKIRCDERRTNETRCLWPRREPRQALSDHGPRTARKDRGGYSGRGENGSGNDHRRPSAIARPLRITPTS